jgi:hypothetical protein
LATRDIFNAIYDHLLTAPTQYVTSYVENNEKYAQIQLDLRTSTNLERLAIELYGSAAEKHKLKDPKSNVDVSFAETLMANEMYTLLENVFLSLNLERNYLHPVHAGWMKVFDHWTNSPILKTAWGDPHKPDDGIQGEYSPAFRRFIELRRKPGGNA